MAGTIRTTFINADLDVNFEYIWNHGRGTTSVSPSWWDDLGDDRTAPNIFTVIDADNIRINTGGAVTGTNEIIMFYDTATIITGRHLFSLDTIASVPTDYRLAVGSPDVGDIDKNILYPDFITDVSNQVGSDFYILDNYFDELDTPTKKSDARGNLDVWSTSEVQTRLDGKVSAVNAFTAADGTVPVSHSPAGLDNIATLRTIRTEAPVASRVTLDQNGKDNNLTVNTQVLTIAPIGNNQLSNGNIVMINIEFSSAVAHSGTWQKVGSFPGYTASGNRFWTFGPEVPSFVQLDGHGTAYIDGGGNIFVKTSLATSYYMLATLLIEA